MTLRAVESAPETAAPNSLTITLAGEAYSIPKLAPKQNRIIVPLIASVFPKINDARRAALVDPADETSSVIAYKWMVGLFANGAYDEMCAIVHCALTRTFPDLTREQFDDWALDTFDLVAAIPVISRQAGLTRV